MGDAVYEPRVTIVREQGPLRTASLPAGETVQLGVHGAVAAHYGTEVDERDAVSTTLDYIVAAAAG